MKKNKILTLAFIFSAMAVISFSQDLGKGGISDDVLKEIKKSVENNADTRALINAVTNNEIKKLALNRENAGKVNHYFSNKIKTTGITNQKSTGRCWLFTGLNTMRPAIIEKYNLPDFDFSHNYSFFWDQLEKSNLFLEAIIATSDKPMDDRTVVWLFKHPINDGGQWTTFADIVEKYGVVPKSVMPETFQSEKTSMMSRLIRRKLKEDGMELREMYQNKAETESIKKRKIEMLSEIYRMLVLNLSEPPTEFIWQYKDKDDKISEPKTYTPKQFYEETIGINLKDFVMFMNDPSRPYNQLYEIEYDRSMYEGYNWKYINLPIEKIKEFAKVSILDSTAMYFSCDVGKQLNSTYGTLDINNYDYDDLMGVKFGMDKKQRIQTFESSSTHGMALIGLNIDENKKIDKWLLENSWGAEKCNKGFLTMTDEWFAEYLFRLVINKKYIDKKTLKILEQKAIKLPPWDPMFAPEE